MCFSSVPPVFHNFSPGNMQNLLARVNYGDETANSEFYFKEGDTTHRLRLTRANDDIATLAYVDENGMRARFPEGFTVFSVVHKEHACFLDGLFVIVWMNSYEVRFNQKVVLSISNQRIQAVSGAAHVHAN